LAPLTVTDICFWKPLPYLGSLKSVGHTSYDVFTLESKGVCLFPVI